MEAVIDEMRGWDLSCVYWVVYGVI